MRLQKEDGYCRFGTAKRLKQILNLDDTLLNLSTFIKSLELFYNPQYILTFGSAKPTRGIR